MTAHGLRNFFHVQQRGVVEYASHIAKIGLDVTSSAHEKIFVPSVINWARQIATKKSRVTRNFVERPVFTSFDVTLEVVDASGIIEETKRGMDVRKIVYFLDWNRLYLIVLLELLVQP